jgi:hypothetical protein
MVNFSVSHQKKLHWTGVFAAICRVLKLVASKSGNIISETYEATEDASGLTNLNVLLVTAISQLGEEGIVGSAQCV